MSKYIYIFLLGTLCHSDVCNTHLANHRLHNMMRDWPCISQGAMPGVKERFTVIPLNLKIEESI